VVVRVNGVDSGMLEEDLHVVLKECQRSGASAWPDSIMLPKCDSMEHLRLVSVTGNWRLTGRTMEPYCQETDN